MKRLLGAVLCVGVLSLPAFANPKPLFFSTFETVGNLVATARLNWKVGDTANYKLQGNGSFPVNGSVVMKVTADTADGITMVQVVDLGFYKTEVEALFDRDTGEIKKYKVNGREETPPANDPSKIKILKQEEARITVPAGSFECIYLLTEDDKGEQTEVWINPMEIPISGMLKLFQKSQGIVLELTSFKRG